MDAPEREYFRKIILYQKAYRKLVEDALSLLLPTLRAAIDLDTPNALRRDSIRMDVNIEKSVKELFEGVQLRLMRMFPDSLLRRWSQQMVGHVNEVQKKNMVRVGQSADLEIEPLMRDGELSPYFNNVVDENVGLIRSIPLEKIPSFKNNLVFSITQDLPQDHLRQIIQANFNVTKGKARLLARDQVNKLNGRLDQYRQQQLGGKRYIWRIADDERVREDHRKLEGKIIEWAYPPITDKRTGRRNHPGQDFQCRCHPEMILDDIIETPEEKSPSLLKFAGAAFGASQIVSKLRSKL